MRQGSLHPEEVLAGIQWVAELPRAFLREIRFRSLAKM